MQMKAKKKWIKRTKTMEQQADEEGWIYVFGPKIIRGWNSIWVEGGRAEGGEGGRGKSSASVYPIPHWVWPSGVDRTMQRQRDRARVRTDTRPVMTTGVSIIFIVCMQNLILERPIPRGGGRPADERAGRADGRPGERAIAWYTIASHMKRHEFVFITSVTEVPNP